MKFINLTPHTINETVSGGSFEPSGTVARLSTSSEVVKTVKGIPLTRTVFGEVEGLPEPEEGVIFIVSGLVLDAVKRVDLVAPGQLVRDESGQPVGCEGFRVAS